VSATVVHAEIDALKRLDIPYFARKRKGRSLSDERNVPPEIIEALRRALYL
jgi:biotin operon repressor